MIDLNYFNILNKYDVFPNCKSLWIKASAKWLNVNVNVNFNSLQPKRKSVQSVTSYYNHCRQVHFCLFFARQCYVVAICTANYNGEFLCRCKTGCLVLISLPVSFHNHGYHHSHATCKQPAYCVSFQTTLLNSVDIEESIALKGKMSVEVLGINQS